jgi:hypothetical protein
MKTFITIFAFLFSCSVGSCFADTIPIPNKKIAWSMQPNVSVSMWSIDKGGNTNPFLANGLGITLQVPVKILNEPLEIALDALVIRNTDILPVGYGPAMFVGSQGICIGATYDFRNKQTYVLINYDLMNLVKK